jgi:hypothetical protein
MNSNFENFKTELKSLIKDDEIINKNYNYKNLNEKQRNFHRELINQIKIYRKCYIKLKTNQPINKPLYKKSIKKINQLILENLNLKLPNSNQPLTLTSYSVLMNSNMFNFFNVLPFLIIIKKLNIPLDTQLPINEFISTKEAFSTKINVKNILNKIKKVDLYLEAFDCSNQVKKQLFDNFLKNVKSKIDSTKNFSMNMSSYTELMNALASYEVIHEKRLLENNLDESLIDTQKPKKKVKI